MKYIDLSKNELPFSACAEFSKYPFSTLNRYPDGGELLLREKISDYYGVNVENVFVGNGAADIMYCCIKNFSIINLAYLTPAFEAYSFMGRGIKTHVKEITSDTNDLIDFIDSLPKDSCFIMCNPHNPTGVLYYYDDPFFKKKFSDKFIIHDEVYMEFTDNALSKTHLNSIISSDRDIMIRSFSKFFGLAGIRVGYAIASANIIKKIYHNSLPYKISDLAAFFCSKALDDHERHKYVYNFINFEKTKLINALSSHYSVKSSCHGNFIWLELGDKAEVIYEFLNKNGVIVKLFNNKGLRISIGTKKENDKVLDLLNIYP